MPDLIHTNKYAYNGGEGVNFLHIIISVLLNSLSLLVTDYIVPGFSVENFQTALLAAIVLGVINTFIKPVFIILTLPINIVTLGLFTFVINALMLYIVGAIIPGFILENFVSALLAAIVLSIVSTGLSMLRKDIAKK